MLKLGIIHVFLEFLFLGEPTAGAIPLRVWQLSNNTYGYGSDGVPPIYPQGNLCGQFGEGPPDFNFPFQAISFDGALTSFIGVELSNSDIREDWSLTLHLNPRSYGMQGVFSYSSPGGQGVTEMRLFLANGFLKFMLSYNANHCGTAKSHIQLPLNTWSFVSLHRKHGILEIMVNTTGTQGTDACLYGLHGPPNGTLKIAGDLFPNYYQNYDGLMECFIVYNEFVQTLEVTRGETSCKTSSIYQPATDSFHSCGETSVAPGHYILDNTNSSPDLSTSRLNTTTRSTTECARFCSCSNNCTSFSLKKETVGHSCFLFDFIADNMSQSWSPDFRYYIVRH